jgi:hypothetical protein
MAAGSKVALREEQDEAARDTVAGVEGVISEKTARPTKMLIFAARATTAAEPEGRWKG